MTSERDVDRARAALDAGRLVVVPTDTVYGVAARPNLPAAVAAVFEVKGRPSDKPLPVLAAGVEDLRAVVAQHPLVSELAARFWPGSLTVVAERAPAFTADLGGEGAGTIAVRVPDHPVALRLLRRAGPLAVTSANRSGGAPATTVGEARRALGRSVAVYLEGGRSAGTPSTIVSLVGAPAVLREGAVPARDVLDALRG